MRGPLAYGLLGGDPDATYVDWRSGTYGMDDFTAVAAGNIAAARSTSAFMSGHGGRVVEDSRGASAFVLELGDETLAFVIEGLGTKSIIAREWLALTGEDRFADIGVDAVGAIVNDVCSVGALPFVVNAYRAHREFGPARKRGVHRALGGGGPRGRLSHVVAQR